MKTLSVSESKIRSILRAEGPMTRPQIKEHSGFAKETVWRVTKGLLEIGIIKQISEATHAGNKGMSGALYVATDEQLPADVLAEVINGWVRAA